MSDGAGAPQLTEDGARFSVHAPDASALWLCLFDAQDGEARLPMERGANGVWQVAAAGVGAGARYGLCADGPYDPPAGLWFDPDKLLLDPYATAIDRPFVYDQALAAPRGQGGARCCAERGKEVDHVRRRVHGARRVAEAGGPMHEGGDAHAAVEGGALAAAQPAVAHGRHHGPAVVAQEEHQR